MSDRSPAVPPLAKWPFFLGDLMLLGAAAALLWQGHRPLALWEAGMVTACVALGAALGVWPFLAENRAAQHLAEAQQLNLAVLQLQNVEALVRQINSASAQWTVVQEAGGKAIESAREISTTMATEARAFQEFLQKANDAEKGHLRLEVEKMRRAEGDWLQVLIRTLDNVYTLFHAAERGQDPNLVAELSSFQRACYDTARWVGVIPLLPKPGEAFDGKLHQAAGGPGTALPPNPCVAEVIATGYRYQGQLVRPSLVRLVSAEVPAPASATVDATPSTALPAAGAESPANVAEAAPLTSEGTAESTASAPGPAEDAPEDAAVVVGSEDEPGEPAEGGAEQEQLRL